jgi:hypothetical protein
MPASEVARLYREHKLHSGPGGPIVKKPSQMRAIQINMAREEGHDIPRPMAHRYKKAKHAER